MAFYRLSLNKATHECLNLRHDQYGVVTLVLDNLDHNLEFQGSRAPQYLPTHKVKKSWPLQNLALAQFFHVTILRVVFHWLHQRHSYGLYLSYILALNNPYRLTPYRLYLGSLALLPHVGRRYLDQIIRYKKRSLLLLPI